MKRQIVAMLLLIILFGCEKNDNKIELLEDEDSIYMPVDELDKFPVLSDSLRNLTEEFHTIFKNYWPGYNNIKERITFSYSYYVDEKGVIKKMRRTNTWARYGVNLPGNYITDIEPRILKILEDVRFEPEKKKGKNVKFRGLFVFMIFKKKTVNGESNLMFGYSGDSSIELKKYYLNNDLEYMIAVDESPEPIGGMETIRKNVSYPLNAKKEGKEGTVIVRAFVDEKGQVIKTEIIDGTYSSLDSAAAQAIMKTKFYPGKLAGNPVKSQVAVPILFKLK